MKREATRLVGTVNSCLCEPRCAAQRTVEGRQLLGIQWHRPLLGFSQAAGPATG